MTNFETIIGIEVHAELNTNEKIFTTSYNNISSKENTNISVIDLGFPGTLPKFNEEVLQKAILIAKALNMKITKTMHWDRKNYFYHDLPKGYQITQLDTPIGRNGCIELKSGKKIEIAFMHMEEDTAQTTNADGNIHLNFNRAGVPLVEIVSSPNLRSGSEAREYLEKLREILIYLDVNDGKLERGSLRADINISIRPIGEKKLYKKVEIKNLNSLTNIELAIKEEEKLQLKKFLTGKKIEQETKRFDESQKKLVTMRKKEGAVDYRYFPEPDLPVIEVTDNYIKKIVSRMPVLPHEIRSKLTNQYKLNEKDVNVLMTDFSMTRFYLQALEKELNAGQVLNYLLSNVNGYLNKEKKNFSDIYLSIDNLADLEELLHSKKISTNHVKKIIPLLLEKKCNVKEIVKELGLEQIIDEQKILEFVQITLKNNPESIDLYKAGKDKSFGFLVGQTLKTSKGQANPSIVNKILKEELEKL